MRSMARLTGDLIVRAHLWQVEGAECTWDGGRPVYQVQRYPYIFRRQFVEGRVSVTVVVPLDMQSPFDDGEVVVWQDGQWTVPGPWQEHLPTVVERLCQEVDDAEASYRAAEERRRQAAYERAAAKVRDAMERELVAATGSPAVRGSDGL